MKALLLIVIIIIFLRINNQFVSTFLLKVGLQLKVKVNNKLTKIYNNVDEIIPNELTYFIEKKSRPRYVGIKIFHFEL